MRCTAFVLPATNFLPQRSFQDATRANRQVRAAAVPRRRRLARGVRRPARGGLRLNLVPRRARDHSLTAASVLFTRPGEGSWVRLQEGRVLFANLTCCCCYLRGRESRSFFLPKRPTVSRNAGRSSSPARTGKLPPWRGRQGSLRLRFPFENKFGQLEAREPDLGAGPPPLVICVVEPGLNILGLLPSQTVTPLSPGRGGARAGGGGCAASVRDVCGPESDMPCPPCVV